MADRWFVLPIVLDETEPDNPVNRPKFSDRDGIEGYSGNTADNELAKHLPDLPPQANAPIKFDDEVFVARLYGDERVLDSIAQERDVHALPIGGREHERVPTALLNARFFGTAEDPGQDQTGNGNGNGNGQGQGQDHGKPTRDHHGWNRGFQIGRGNE